MAQGTRSANFHAAINNNAVEIYTNNQQIVTSQPNTKQKNKQ